MASSIFDPSLISSAEADKLLQKINNRSQASDGCILWTLSTDSAGYPQMKLGKLFQSRIGIKPYPPAHIILSIKSRSTLNNFNHHVSHLCHNKLSSVIINYPVPILHFIANCFNKIYDHQAHLQLVWMSICSET